MKILAIDPGYERLGIAVLEKLPRQKDALLYSDCFKTSAKLPFSERLLAIGDEISRLIEKWRPEAFVLEKLFFQNNQTTAMHVAEVRGALMYLAVSRGIPLFEYVPQEIKMAVAGSGSADKQAVIDMVGKLIKIEKEIQHDDEYDAIAAALTHSACAGNMLGKALKSA